MCTSPIRMPNPYKGLGIIDTHRFKDTINSYIEVPCGQCLQCLSNRQNFFNQRIQMESLRSHLFMLTLTYNEDMLPRINYKGYDCCFADWKDIQDMFKRIRKRGYPFRYLCVSEYGKKRRAHFHAIIAVEKSDIHPSVIEQTYFRLFLEEWRINVGSSRFPRYISLCTFARKGRKSNYDFHRIVHIPNHDNDTAFYVTKYLLKADKVTQKLLHKIKYDPLLNDDQTSLLLRLIKPRCTMSKDLGDYRNSNIASYITKNLSLYADMPQFADLYSGHTSLLSRYYRRLVPHEFYSNNLERNSCYKDVETNVLDIKHTLSIGKPIYVNKPITSMILDTSLHAHDYTCVSNRAKNSAEKLKIIRSKVDDY